MGMPFTSRLTTGASISGFARKGIQSEVDAELGVVTASRSARGNDHLHISGEKDLGVALITLPRQVNELSEFLLKLSTW